MMPTASRANELKAARVAAILAVLTVPLTFGAGAATLPGTEWQTQTPAEAGLNVAKLNAIRSYLGGRGCIVRHGCLV